MRSARRDGGGLAALVPLIVADYRAHYERQGIPDGWRGPVLFCARMFTNPSMHAVVLIRLALCGPRRAHWLWRNILIAKHAIDLGDGAEIGPGLMLPHPMGICIGRGSSLGRDIAVLHGVTIGSTGRHHRVASGSPRRAPTISDGVIIYPGSVVVGAIEIGAGAIIGAQAFVDRDVEPGETVRGRRQ